MSIPATCPFCGQVGHVPEKAIGHKAKCPSCGKAFEISDPGIVEMVSPQEASPYFPPPVRQAPQDQEPVVDQALLDFEGVTPQIYDPPKRSILWRIYAAIGGVVFLIIVAVVVIGVFIHERNKRPRLEAWHSALDGQNQGPGPNTLWHSALDGQNQGPGPNTLAELIRFFREHGMSPTDTSFTHGMADGDMNLNFCNQGLVDEMEALKARGQKLNDLMNAHDQERGRKAGLVEDEFRNTRNRQLRDQRTRLADVEKAQQERARKQRMIDQEFEQANREPLDEQRIIRAKLAALQNRINEETVLVTCCLDALVAEADLGRKKEKLELAHDAKRMDDHFLCWRNFVFEGEPRILDKIRRFLKSSG